MAFSMAKPKKLNLEEYDMLQTLGQGGFGRVRLAKHKQSNRYVAIKSLKKEELIRLQQVDHILNENNILANLNHPFVVSFEGFFQNRRYLYLVMEFVSGGELFTFLRNQNKLENDHAMFYAAQVTSIFEYIHLKNIIYRDLKPENLLISQDGYLKLTDFGFAKVLVGRTYTLCGTPEYIAPEILLNKGHGKAVDWWTLGVLIYEMIAGIDPFSDEEPMIIYQNILNGKIQYPRHFDKNAKSLVRHLLTADLSKRYGNLKDGTIYFGQDQYIGAEDIKKHRWFKMMDWSLLCQKGLPVPYEPHVKSPNDTSNFNSYPDSDRLSPAIKPEDDPFNQW